MSLEQQAVAFGWPVFPIRITRTPAGKFEKKPLTQHGHKDATQRVAMFGSLWEHANGFGVPMGQIASGVGLYAFDLDTDRGDEAHMLAWLSGHNVPVETRMHRTPSGGYHLLYQLPGSHLRLPSRANIVPGLDSRGQGGWIAFGEGYLHFGSDYLALLPPAACEAVLAGYSGGQSLPGGDVCLADYRPPAGVSETLLQHRVASTLARNKALLRRWHAVKPNGDQSRSARDHSVAFLLAINGFRTNEITYALLNIFEHGACRDPGMPEHTRVRAAMRSAAKARNHVTELQSALARAGSTDPAAVSAYLASISFNENGDRGEPAADQSRNEV